MTASIRSRPGPRTLVYGALALALPTLVVTAAVSPDPIAPPAAQVVEPLPVAAGILGEKVDRSLVLVPDVLERGDTLFRALARSGVLDQGADRFLRSAGVARPLRDAEPGSYLRILRTADGELVELTYLPPSGVSYAVSRDQAGFKVTRTVESAPVRQRYRTGVGGPSLHRAFADAGLPRSVGEQVLGIFSKQFDLHGTAREIERFAVLYEERLAGATLREGRVLAVEIVRAGKPYRAFWFAPDGRSGDYFSAEGFSLKREFLPAPLEFTEVSSWFGQTRQIGRRFQESHPGIDYAAPIGTPVHATAAGTVEFVGTQNGYGNLVVIKHRGAVTTHYAHLDAFAAGLEAGAHVRQGELIGYVGRTGWTTGPHLHYELRVDDKPVNPEAAGIPAEALATPENLQAFRESIASAERMLDMLRPTTVARFD